MDALRLAGHVYVQLSGPACATDSLAVISDGRLANISVPKVRFTAIAAASASRLLLVAESCMASSGLLWFNPRNSAEVQVLKPNRGQGVISWVPYYELNRG